MWASISRGIIDPYSDGTPHVTSLICFGVLRFCAPSVLVSGSFAWGVLLYVGDVWVLGGIFGRLLFRVPISLFPHVAFRGGVFYREMFPFFGPFFPFLNAPRAFSLFTNGGLRRKPVFFLFSSTVFFSPMPFSFLWRSICRFCF